MTGRRGYGDGSVHKRERDGMWVATIELPRGLDGARRRKSFTARTRQEARAKLRDAQRALDNGRDLAGGRRTVADVVRWWLETEVLPSSALETRPSKPTKST